MHKALIYCLQLLITQLLTLHISAQVLTKRETANNVYVSGITWRMHPKYTPPKSFDEETSIVEGYQRKLHKYEASYVKAQNYGVTIEAQVLIKQPLNNIKYKWEIIGVKKSNGTPNPYNKTYVTNKKGLFSVSATSGQTDINPQHENIETLPFDGVYKIRITPISVINNIEKTYKRYETFIQLTDYLIVALGDSFTSGEGNPDVNGETNDPIFCDQIKLGIVVRGSTFDMKKNAVWLEPGAHRSFHSPSSQLALQLENNDDHTVVTFLNFGTSGARINKGLLQPQHPAWQTTGQILEAKNTIGDRNIDAVIMSIGINDIGASGGGISSLIESAAKPGNGLSEEIIEEVNSQFQHLSNNYQILDREIREHLSPRDIFLYEVPINMFRNSSNQIVPGCGALSFVSQSEASTLDEMGRRLLQKMQNACNINKWSYIGGVVAAFRGHGYCEESETSWYRTGSTSCKIQGDISGTIHPNQDGHKNISALAYPIVLKKLKTRPKQITYSNHNTN